MTDQREDKEFEAFLAGESGLADRYSDLGHEEPPPEHDARILAEAREAAKIHRLEFGPRGGWLKPVALAATVLLSLSLVMNIAVKSPTRFEQVVTETSETSVQPDSESPARKFRALETPRAASNQAKAQDRALEELARTTVDSVEADAKMPGSLEEISVTARLIDRDAALLVVAEYVAAIDIKTGKERGTADEAERAQLATAESDMVGERESDNGPDVLLRDIDRLSASGETVEAVRRLDEFLLRYPDHPVSIKIRQQEN